MQFFLIQAGLQSQSYPLTLFGMGFFMYVKGMGGGKITPQSKTFKNDAKKLKVSHKLETPKNFPKYQKKLLPSIFFDDVSTFFGQKIQKMTNLS